jgi:hypothetical protein
MMALHGIGAAHDRPGWRTEAVSSAAAATRSGVVTRPTPATPVKFQDACENGCAMGGIAHERDPAPVPGGQVDLADRIEVDVGIGAHRVEDRPDLPRAAFGELVEQYFLLYFDVAVVVGDGIRREQEADCPVFEPAMPARCPG